MPATNIHEHVRGTQGVLDATTAAGEAALISIQIDQRSSLRGSVVGLLRFHNASELHFREYVDTSRAETKLMYPYQSQNATKDLIFRYDNAQPITHRCPKLSIGQR